MSKEPRKRDDPRLAGDGVDAHLAELRAVGMHRAFLHLERRRRLGLARDLVAPGAREDRGVALAAARLVGLAQTAVARLHLLRLEPGERRVVAGELEQLLHQHVDTPR